MSSRFGRNKRRRAREEAAALNAELTRTSRKLNDVRWQLEVAKEVAKGREELLRKVQAEIADVRAAVIEGFGENSILLSASAPRNTFVDALPDYLQVARPETVSSVMMSAEELRREMRHAPTVDLCRILSAEVGRDHWARVTHFYIVDRDRRILGYAQPERAALEMPKKVFITRTAEAMAELLRRTARGETR